MKNIFKSLMLVAVAAMAFTSCNKENFNDNLVQDNSVTMTFVADAPESRTSVSIDGETAKFSWSAGDKVGFYYVDVEGTGKKKKGSNEATISGSTATFSASFDKLEGATAYNVGAFYPSDSWVGHSETAPFNNVKVKIASGQNLTERTFDPKADLMMSKPFMGIALNSDNTKTLQFSRIAAIGKMNLKLDGMENGEVIESVKFGFAEGTHFNGPVSIDLENSSYTLGTTDTSNAVTLTGELVANEDRTAIFFTCFPGEYSGEYTIEVKTDKATYTKKETISNALVFTAGNVLNFNATVGNREEEKVEAGQVVDELNRVFTGATTTTYINWSGKISNSTAVYAGNSAGGNSSIQLRTTNNNSGIVTTTTGGKVRKIVVEWNSNTKSGRILDIYGKNTAYSAATDLYSSSTQGTKLGSIKCGTSTELTIEGDYAYIGLRSSADAMYLSKIIITWEESTDPVQLATPIVTSSVNANVVTLNWGVVAGAAHYTVQVDDDVEEIVSGTEYVFEGEYGVDYKFTVKAIADDTTKYVDSEACVITVKTQEAGATVAKFVKVTSAPSDWSGTYLIVYETGKLAFDGSRTSLDAVSNGIAVTITNNEIEATSTMMNSAFTITKNGNSYCIMSASGYYIGNNSNSNGLSTHKSTKYNNTITCSSGEVNVKSSGGAYLRYNSSNDQKRFRYYKSSSYSSQKAISLYKLNN